ncbi:uncharacterized protein JN550_013824 [Neoarthrinium moseri]|uniref:uncharacterized protein n=1 Tax=Neoarthrinium moseri TaxID=1658444 RepID=UPI001FDCC040|nr:uncharacterized protein JN550_013824 [Neoarthrinium moseri]KAI1856350.1 hypothetical protein JN550_013824 [Neoarthrinium moseri]
MASPAFLPSFTQGGQRAIAGTPPERRGALLLTPPASVERRTLSDPSVEGLLKIFENHQHNSLDAQEASVRLSPPQFDQLKAALSGDPSLDSYVKDKVRVDYDPQSQDLIIRMPTPIHEFLSASVADEIYENIKRIAAQTGAAGEFAAQIRNGASSRILLKEDTEEEGTSNVGCAWQRHPDGQFQHQKAAYPGVVVEISYSQDGKDLGKLAWQYIQLSNGDIKVVIGIDINDVSKSSTVSLWRAKYVREDDEDVLDVEQEIAYQVVGLALRDFAPDELCEGLGATGLQITYARLAELLIQAQGMQTAREHATDGGVRSSRKRRRPAPVSSSPDRLLSDDETQFRLDEEKVAEEAAAADDDFQLPTRKKRP